MCGFTKPMLAVLLATLLLCGSVPALAADANDGKGKTVQAQVVLTVAESKRLIAKAVAQMPIVRDALNNGMIIVAKGTTNTYVAEELLGETIAHGAYVYGRTYPTKGGKILEPAESVAEVVLIKGELQRNLPLAEAVQQLKPGDVVIKGANALDYQNRTAGVLIGSSSGGTSGKIMPYVVGSKVHLVIPVGLEKQVCGNVVDIANMMREPVESLNDIPSMFLLTGHIMTEIEAVESLAGVAVFQAAAGGIGGAEGAVRLVCRGTKKQVENALKLVEQIQGEPPFIR